MPAPTVECNLLPSADGSARFGFPGQGQVLGIVRGPVAVRHRDESEKKAVVSVAFEPLRNAVLAEGIERRTTHGPPETRLENALARVLDYAALTELHPLTAIEITCLEEEPAPGGFPGTFASATNAAVLALADAGVPLQCLVAAVVVAEFSSGEAPVASPSADDLDKAVGVHCVVFESCSFKVVAVESQGRSSGDFAPIVSAARPVAEQSIVGLFRERLEQAISQSSC